MGAVAAATASTDGKVHPVFLDWLVDKGELASSPMDRMKAPHQASEPVPTLVRR